MRRNFRKSAKLPEKPCLPDHLLHLGVNARDLLESERVDLVGRAVDRREVPDEVRVVLLAAREIAGPHSRAGAGHVVAGHELQERAVRRNDVFADGLLPGGAKARAVGLGHADRERRERREESALRGIRDDVGLDRLLVSGQSLLRKSPARLQPVAQELGVLRHVFRKGVEAREEVLVVARRVEGHLARELRELHVEAAVGVDREAVVVQLELADRVLELHPLERLAVAFRFVERRRGDRLQPLEKLPTRIVAPREVRHLDRRQPVVVAVVPDLRRVERILAELELPDLVE